MHEECVPMYILISLSFFAHILFPNGLLPFLTLLQGTGHIREKFKNKLRAHATARKVNPFAVEYLCKLIEVIDPTDAIVLIQLFCPVQDERGGANLALGQLSENKTSCINLKELDSAFCSNIVYGKYIKNDLEEPTLMYQSYVGMRLPHR